MDLTYRDKKTLNNGRYLNDKIRVKISIGEANNIFKKCCNKDVSNPE